MIEAAEIKTDVATVRSIVFLAGTFLLSVVGLILITFTTRQEKSDFITFVLGTETAYAETTDGVCSDGMSDTCTDGGEGGSDDGCGDGADGCCSDG